MTTTRNGGGFRWIFRANNLAIDQLLVFAKADKQDQRHADQHHLEGSRLGD